MQVLHVAVPYVAVHKLGDQAAVSYSVRQAARLSDEVLCSPDTTGHAWIQSMSPDKVRRTSHKVSCQHCNLFRNHGGLLLSLKHNLSVSDIPLAPRVCDTIHRKVQCGEHVQHLHPGVAVLVV